MIQITKKELLDKYGIDLEKGSYTVEKIGNSYRINILKDDTSGCILVGSSVKDETLLHSKTTLQQLMLKLTAAAKKDGIKISILNPVKEELKVEPVVKTIEPKVVIQEPVLIKENKTNFTNLINSIKQWLTLFFKNS